MSATQEAGEIFGAGRGPAHAMLRSPTVLIASIGLWGMNVFFYKLFGIDYVQVLKHDLLKLEQQEENEFTSDQNHHHYQEDDPRGATDSEAAMSSTLPTNNNSTTTTTSATIQSASSSRDPSPTQQLIQRQHSITPPDDITDEEDEDFLLVQSHHPDDMSTSKDDPMDLNSVITWDKLVGLSVGLLLLLHVTYFAWLDVWHGGTIGAVALFYTLVVTGIALPLRWTKWLRRATVLVLQRTYELIHPRCHCVTHDPGHPPTKPPRFIPFVDVFFADAMCSLSKVFFDWGMLFHMASHYPNPVPASAHNILIPSACAAVPYVIRARQCLIMYTVGRITQQRNRFQHLWNAAKYTSSILPLVLSAYQQTIPKRSAAEWETTLICLMVINSSFSLYWDIVMDWGMWQENPLGVAFCDTHHNRKIGAAHTKRHPTSTTPKIHAPPKLKKNQNCVQAFLRARLRFGVSMSALILGMDVLLRFSWTLRFAVAAHVLRLDGDSFVLCTQFLEVFRRALWNLLRVEWEHMKQQQHTSVSSPLAIKQQSIPPSAATQAVPQQHHRRTSAPTMTDHPSEQELVTFLPTAGKFNQL